MKYLLFGTGDYYERYKKWFNKSEVVALLDNSTKKQGTLIDGLRVLSPWEGVKLDYDVIVILSFYVKSMKTQLLELGVGERYIYHFFDLHKLLKKEALCKPIHFFGRAQSLIERGKCGRKILLLSHDLTLGGPALALLHAAEILIFNGYDVVFASMLDGPLKEILLEKRIAAVVDVNLQVGTMQDVPWIKKFDLIICNTIGYYVFLSKRDENIPVVWWLHDSSFFYDGVDKEVLQSISVTNLTFASVGPIPKDAVHSFLHDVQIKNLLYGVLDVTNGSQKSSVYEGCNNYDRLRFLTIGCIEDRKGQDILIRAIGRLPEKIAGLCEFYLVGQDLSVLAQKLKEEMRDNPSVKFMGKVGRTDIYHLLNSADMLICPSREDPMPTAAAEAMMYGVPCIVSNTTGTAGYMKDGVNGFIVPSEDVQALADRITWCVENRGELGRMGRKARTVYEQVFSMQVFEGRLMELVEECMK